MPLRNGRLFLCLSRNDSGFFVSFRPLTPSTIFAQNTLEMANIVNQAQTITTVDGQQAEQELKKLEVLAKAYKDRMVEATIAGDRKAFDKSSKELKQVNREMQSVIRSAFDVNKVMNNLSTTGPKDLKKALQQLNKELNSGKVARGSKDWDELQRKIKAVRSEITKINAESQVTQSTWSNMANGFNKYFAVVTTVIASVTGLSFAFRKMTEDMAKMDDVYADVMKTTGMTRDEVVDLNETFKKMDTRTSREELNLLGRDAGKLGLTLRKDILDFIEAGNQINVAIKEDLGEGAIKDIGKITDVYKLSTKELDRLDLKGRMLAIGSSINELGQSSTANEAYMVNFTKRLGGVASQAGISVQNILGYASALDQSGQAVEMSATAMQKFIMKLMGDPAKFAKMAGLEVKEFNKLLQTDTNEAIKQVLTALSQKGGFQKLIPIFKDMGLDGARAVGVLSALATNIEKVNVAQEISNKAFSDGTSVTDEYRIKNNNLMAVLEKGRKAFHDASLELGERLSPALITSTKGITYLVKLLPAVIDFFIKYGKAIASLVVTIGTYIVVVKVITALTGKWTLIETLHNATLKTKNGIMITLRGTLYALQVAYYTLTGQVAKARGAMLAFAAVTGLTNPLIILTGAIIALAAGVYILNRNSKEAYTITKLLNDINKEATRSIISEKNELAQLLTIAKNEKISKEERLKAIKRLNEISPEYLGALSLENINTKEATKYVDIYTESLIKNARAKYTLAKIDELTKLQADQSDSKNYYKKNPMNIKTIALKIFGIDTDVVDNARDELIDKSNKQIGSMLETLEDTYQDMHGASKKGLINELQTNRSFLAEYEKQHADVYNRIQEKKKNAFYSSADEFRDNVELNLLSQKLDTQRKLVQEQELEYANRVKPEKIVDDTLPADKPEKAAVQRKKVQDAMRKLEIDYNNSISDIKKKFRSGEIESEFEFNNQLLAAQDDYDNKRIVKLNELKKTVSDPAIKDELLRQISEIDNAIIDREIKRQSEIKRIILNADPAKAEQEAYDTRLRELGLFGETSQTLAEKISKATTDKEKALLQEKYDSFQILAKQHQEKMSKIERPEVRIKLKKLDEDQADDEKKLAEQRAKGLMSERLYKSQLLLLDIKYTSEKLAIDGLTEEQRIKLQKDSLDKQAQFYEENGEIRDRLNKKKKIENLQEARDMELAFLKESLDNDLQNTELYKQLELAIIEKYNLLEEEQDKAKRERMLQTAQFTLDSMQELMNSYSFFVRASNDAETAAINKRYESQIKAAGNNAKRVKKLEEQRDKEIKEANRENEDRSFKIQVAMAMASAIQGAINAYTSTAAIPIIGPALAPIAAGVAATAGLINVAAIKKQHDAAMANYWVGGYTEPGYKYDVAGYVHKGEFVGNAESVKNPHVRRVYDVIHQAQRTNTVSGLRSHDFAAALEYKERVAQLPSQRIEAASTEQQQQNEYLMMVLIELSQTNQKLKERLDEPFVTVNSVTGPNGIKQAMDTHDRLIKNKSRGL